MLSIYTTLILFANSLGVTVSAAHRIAGNIFAVAVLCGDPLIQAGQAFMPRYLLEEVPRRRAARQMAGLLQSVGWGTGFLASFACFLACMFGGEGETGRYMGTRGGGPGGDPGGTMCVCGCVCVCDYFHRLARATALDHVLDFARFIPIPPFS